MVEFALLLPFLALLLFAIIQYGFIFSAYITLRHGAQVTSRTMALPGASINNLSAVACTAITPMLNCANLQSAQLTPIAIGASATTTNAVRVTLTYNLPLIIRFVVPGATGNNLTLTAVAVDRTF
ncbi:pilus assembly protein [bacterium]|nr:pilus assembly protein [bacterium]